MTEQSISWATGAEIKFIKSLFPTELSKYIQTLKLRVNWGKIEKKCIYSYLGLNSKRPNPQNKHKNVKVLILSAGH